MRLSSQSSNSISGGSELLGLVALGVRALCGGELELGRKRGELRSMLIGLRGGLDGARDVPLNTLNV